MPEVFPRPCDPATQVPAAVSIPVNDLLSSRPRLDFLDGIRALACAYVVVCHAYFGMDHTIPGPKMPDLLRKLLLFSESGRLAVSVFIVLSGFCLMLPVCWAGGEGRMPGGFWKYLKRRAKRILPPYYAALALSSVMILMLGLWLPKGHLYRDTWNATLNPGAYGTHLLLIHNWFHKHGFSIDAPMWSVATEWQIYFLFILLFLPAWRWFGMVGAIGVAVLVGMYVPKGVEAYGAWFPALFTMGMVAAGVLYSPVNSRWEGERAQAIRRVALKLPWGHLLWEPEELVDLIIKEAGNDREWAPGQPLSSSHLLSFLNQELNYASPACIRRILRRGPWRVDGWVDGVLPETGSIAREMNLYRAVPKVPTDSLHLHGLRFRLTRLQRSPWFTPTLALSYRTRSMIKGMLRVDI